MRLILFDGSPEKRANFRPLSWSRPIWELRYGMSSLVEKLSARLGSPEACFVESYMAASYQAKTSWKVNDTSVLKGDAVLIVNGCLKAEGLKI